MTTAKEQMCRCGGPEFRHPNEPGPETCYLCVVLHNLDRAEAQIEDLRADLARVTEELEEVVARAADAELRAETAEQHGYESWESAWQEARSERDEACEERDRLREDDSAARRALARAGIFGTPAVGDVAGGIEALFDRAVVAEEERDEAREERDRLLRERDNPETLEFLKGVGLEAAHQRARWGVEHDAGKTDADWFWLVGYLAGKALHKPEKRLHHIITTAAALMNWHQASLGLTNMRPGIDGERALANGKDGAE